MDFKKLHDVNSQKFKEAWDIYESSFPEDEKRTLESHKKLMKSKNYSFLTIIKENLMVAILIEWDFGDFFFIEHLAVKEDLRGKGIGTELLNKYILKNNKKILFEVEMPKTEIAKKRIHFYEKLGFKLNNFDYVQPPYDTNKSYVNMFLMSHLKCLSKVEFDLIRDKLHVIVYGLERSFVE